MVNSQNLKEGKFKTLFGKFCKKTCSDIILLTWKNERLSQHDFWQHWSTRGQIPIRTLSIDAIQKANSGHPGLPMGAAPMAYVLWSKFLNVNPLTHRDWSNRDRFVLSAGHGSAMLYSLLHLAGYDVTIDDLKNFRQWQSRTHQVIQKWIGQMVLKQRLGR